jgi:hypothetical protein
MTAVIPPSNLATTGLFPITVNNPDNPGGTSMPMPFMVGVSVSVSPIYVALPVTASQQFTATVQGSSNTAVTWSVNGVVGGDSSFGIITSGGLFTAPAVQPNPSLVTITATSEASPGSSATANVEISAPNGSVYSGTDPISGAHVYLFAANNTGYGQASISLLNGGITGHSDSIGAYVLTGADGSFSISGDYTCNSGSEVYLYSLGGDAGSGNNPSAGLLAILGSCPGSGEFDSTSSIRVNEVSTIAAAYAFAGFATDATHVSSSNTALAQIGISNAFANAANLANGSTGTALTTTPAGNGTVPQAKINLLANILNGCVNSGTTCKTLLSTATPIGSPTPSNPTDTATVAINIAHNPGPNYYGTYCALESVAAPFQPSLPCSQNISGGNYGYDFTIALNFTGGGIQEPQGIAIDGFGNAWAENNDATITKLSSAGAILSGTTGFTVSAPSGAYSRAFVGIAVDDSGNAWIPYWVNYTQGRSVGVVELSNSGSALSSTEGYPLPANSTLLGSIAMDSSGNAWVDSLLGYGIAEISSSGTLLSGSSMGYDFAKFSSAPPVGSSTPIACDASGNAWVAGPNNVITELSATGAVSSGTTGYTGGGLVEPTAIAVDGQGSVWVTNTDNSVSKFSSSGVPYPGSCNGVFACGGGLSIPNSIAIDGDGNAWISSTDDGAQSSTGSIVAGSVTEISSSGIVISPYGFAGGSVYSPTQIAIDESGNVWIANQGDTSGISGGLTYAYESVTELVGAAAPVVAPLATGAKNGTLGKRP